VKAPDTITVMRLEVVVMPNGEIICAGKTVGWVNTHGKYLTGEVPSPVLAFQAWLTRYTQALGRKVTQNEYALLQAGFFAAHPGTGPRSTFATTPEVQP